MSDSSPFPDLFELGQDALERFRREFSSYGIECDPQMELRRGAGLLCYYDLTDRQIYLSMPDLKAPTGKLQLMMLRQMMGAENSDTLMRFLAIFIPFVVAHEMTHHFRHRYGQFSEDSWHEEQLANKMAAAVNKHRLPPAEKAFAVQFLETSMKKLGEKIGIGQDAVDSYYDIAHALHTSEQINNDDMINFRMAQGIASNSSSATLMLKRSGNLGNNLEDRLQKRRALIEHFNEQYASDTARYIYYQIGWVYLAMKSQEASYVDEFARRYLGISPQLIEISPPETYDTRAIYSCFKASQEISSASTTISRYFYKRYRTLLLDYLKKNHQILMRDVQDASDLNFDFLATWNDRLNDPLNFMISIASPFAREIFPSRIVRASIMPDIKLPKDLPTDIDREIYQQVSKTDSGAMKNTLAQLEKLDQLELFRPLSPEIQLEIAHKLYKVYYQAGETLVWEGESNNDVFVLLEGQLEAITPEKANNSMIHPGEVFGEIAWLTKGSRLATVHAITPSTCMVIKDNDLRLLCYQYPSILMSIAASTAQRFRDYRLQ
jgi:hypothetical protein